MRAVQTVIHARFVIVLVFALVLKKTFLFEREHEHEHDYKSKSIRSELEIRFGTGSQYLMRAVPTTQSYNRVEINEGRLDTECLIVKLEG